jgi:uncharacterized protein involved in exopolysaccharide biosynthesis
MNDGKDKFDDEIELMEYLQVIWKWKYVILGGSLLCALIAGVISFQMSKVYSISTVLVPGILRVGENGNNVYIDSPSNISGLLQADTFNVRILDALKKTSKEELPKELKFSVKIPQNSNILRISYESSDIDQGMLILSYLNNFLIEKYDEVVKYYQNEYVKEIEMKKAQIDSHKAILQSSKQKIKALQKRINELQAEVDLINNNTIALIKERDKFLSRNSSDNILSSILYTNTIQQNLALANTYKNEINEYNSEKENENADIGKTQYTIKELLEEIKNLEFKKNNIKSIQILQPPFPSPYPVKPKKKLNVMLAGGVGLFLMLFLAFFSEYLSEHKGKDQLKEGIDSQTT